MNHPFLTGLMLGFAISLFAFAFTLPEGTDRTLNVIGISACLVAIVLLQVLR
jgi:hypothetical protein